jgi:aspartate racemase
MPEPPRSSSPLSPDRPRFRIGIVGGMGPMAGVHLQQLIIRTTPAERDQDHVEVVCFTNPHVPERMRSLAEDGGRRYAEAVRESARLVARAGATHIVIACNTAHARLAEIRGDLEVPILDMIDIGLKALAKHHGTGRRAGLLATTGTLEERVYQRTGAGLVAEWVLPEHDDQAEVAAAILAVKQDRAGDAAAGLGRVASRLASRGAELIVVGCTELSMCHAALEPAGIPLVDPLEEVARHLVEIGTGGCSSARLR